MITSMKHELYCVIIVCKENGDILYGACECPVGRLFLRCVIRDNFKRLLTLDTDESEYSDTNSSDITDPASECESEWSNDCHFESVSQLTNEFGVTNSISCANDDGLLSFYRLVGCLYWAKHKSAFPQKSSPNSLFYLHASDGKDTLHTHIDFLEEIRPNIWNIMIFVEDMMPSLEALQLHWKRSCWVEIVWKQTLINFMAVPNPLHFGWQIDELTNHLKVVWDTKVNISKVNSNIPY
ncbi:unnamed protein product [Mytilus edulis]|uniref:Uncharacterized protein n=1 Tax=Mytilus edulis TaxID=6550 RepID=A0A8S3S6X4_MYTED|nr:unnamed protein product [Mytilus edulis]